MTSFVVALVWSPAAISAAVVGGMATGLLVVGAFASSPRYSALLVPPSRIGLLTAVLGSFLGAVFFIGQAVATYADGDPLWPRVVARFGVWLIYAAALGLGTWIRLALDERARRARLVQRARRELS